MSESPAATSKRVHQASRPVRSSSAETRSRLLDAAFAAVREDGYANATARSLAARAGCNQALIYYHFDGIGPLLVAALARSSQQRLSRYREVLAPLVSPEAVFGALRELHVEDVDSGHMTVSAELLGALAADPSLVSGVSAEMRQWGEYITGEIDRIAAAAGISTMGISGVIAPYVIALMMGTQLYSRVDSAGGGFDGALALAALAWKGALPSMPSPVNSVAWSPPIGESLEETPEQLRGSARLVPYGNREISGLTAHESGAFSAALDEA